MPVHNSVTGQYRWPKAVKMGGEPPVTAAIGARTLAVLDAARQSALEGRSVTLEGN